MSQVVTGLPALAPTDAARLAASRRRVAVLVLVLGTLAGVSGLAPVASAAGVPPSITITSPADGSVTNDQTPTFSGTTDDPFNEFTETSDKISLRVYAGTSASGSPVEPPVTETAGTGTTWSLTVAEPLAPGTYTAQAEQKDLLLGSGKSQPVTITLDTTAPTITLTSPSSRSTTTGSSEVVSGSAGTAPGDSPTVTVQLYAGPSIGQQQPLESVSVQRSGEAWSAVLGGLTAGTSYVVQAEQADAAGNVGLSAGVGFMVAPPPSPTSPTPPQASFRWFPAAPRVGEAVSLVSSSTDLTSPLSTFAWALAPTAHFVVGQAVLRTVFRKPGAHTLRLRVTAADGLSSTATATVRVRRAHITQMQPSPVVRMAGILTGSGVNVGLLSAQVPIGARVTVTCRGRGCPARSETRLAATGSRRGGEAAVLVTFRDFQRHLRAGIVLEIRITKPGRIGKYTSFVIRRGLPRRKDRCLFPADPKPIACPVS
jgi:hypothetical protein